MSAMLWFEHRWRVQKEEMRKKEFDESIESPEFLTIKNGLRYHWQLELHPKGEKGEDCPTADKQKDMCLTLWIREGGIKSAVEAELKMTIVGGEEVSSDGSKVFNTRWDTEPSKGEFYGYWFLIYPHQKLDKVGTQTEVQLRVQIGIWERDFDLHHLYPDPPLHNCPKGLAFYKETVLREQSHVGSRDEGNAVLIAGEERIQCHRLVLMESSPVFQRMFSTECQESETGEVTIPDVSADTLKQLLYFFYVEALLEGRKAEDVLSLLAAAHKYDVKSLEVLCSKEAVAHLSPQTAVESLVLAKGMGLGLLEMKATHFLLDNWKELSLEEKKELKKDDTYLSVMDVSSMEKAVEITLKPE